MSTVIEDIRQKIRSRDPVTRLILINVTAFLLICLLQAIYHSNSEGAESRIWISTFIHKLSFPLEISVLLHSPWSIITSLFIHGELFHIFWNMMLLYWFGEILSGYTSARKILPLYLLGGVAGSLITLLLVNTIPALEPYSSQYLIGASAGTTAIIVAAATLVPNKAINVLFIGTVRLLYVAFFVIFIDVLNIAFHNDVVGNLSHLGGALMGYLFIVQYKKGKDMANPINRFFDWLSGLFGNSSAGRMKVVHKRAISDEEYNYQKNINQKQVDAILDKISRSGYESLSKNEKDILFRASHKK